MYIDAKRDLTRTKVLEILEYVGNETRQAPA